MEFDSQNLTSNLEECSIQLDLINRNVKIKVEQENVWFIKNEIKQEDLSCDTEKYSNNINASTSFYVKNEPLIIKNDIKPDPEFENETICGNENDKFLHQRNDVDASKCEENNTGIEGLTHISPNYKAHSINAYRPFKSAPRSILTVKTTENNSGGVFAIRYIPKNVRIGPIEGLIGVRQDFRYIWRMENGRFFFSSKVGNFGRFINYAESDEEQNLAIFQYEGLLYFKTIKHIDVDQELLVRYDGLKTVKMFGNVLYCIPPYADCFEDAHICYDCNLGFKTQEYAHQHVCSKPPDIPNIDIGRCIHCNIFTCEKIYMTGHITKCAALFASSVTSEKCNEPKDKSTVAPTQKNTEPLITSEKCNEPKQKSTVASAQTNTQPEVNSTETSSNAINNVDTDLHDLKKEVNSSETSSNAISIVGTDLHEDILVDCLLSQLDKVVSTRNKVNLKYPCPKCTFSTYLEHTLKTHFVRHFGLYLYKCRICNKRFNNLAELHQHEMTHPGYKKTYACPDCDFKTQSGAHLYMHRRKMHEKERQYKCRICGYKCGRLKPMSAHWKRYHSGKIHKKVCEKSMQPLDGYYNLYNIKSETTGKLCKGSCIFCGDKVLDLHSHVIDNHISADISYKCGKCEFKSCLIKTIVQHIKNHKKWIVVTTDGTKYYKCKFCSKMFLKRYFVEMHYRSHTEELPYSCRLCEYKCEQEKRLKKHMQFKHPNEKDDVNNAQSETETKELDVPIEKEQEFEQYRCKICGLYRVGLRTHIKLMHMENFMYKCSKCPYICDELFELADHMQEKHKDSEAIPDIHNCNICGQRCANLKSHVRKHHMTSENRYKCYKCYALYDDMAQLEQHAKDGHSKESCGLCNDKYINLTRHMKRFHRNGKKFICSPCKIEIPKLDDFVAHVNKRHPTAPRSYKLYRCPFCKYTGKLQQVRGHLRKHKMDVPTVRFGRRRKLIVPTIKAVDDAEIDDDEKIVQVDPLHINIKEDLMDTSEKDDEEMLNPLN